MEAIVEFPLSADTLERGYIELRSVEYIDVVTDIKSEMGHCTENTRAR